MTTSETSIEVDQISAADTFGNTRPSIQPLLGFASTRLCLLIVTSFIEIESAGLETKLKERFDIAINAPMIDYLWGYVALL